MIDEASDFGREDWNQTGNIIVEVLPDDETSIRKSDQFLAKLSTDKRVNPKWDGNYVWYYQVREIVKVVTFDEPKRLNPKAKLIGKFQPQF